MGVSNQRKSRIAGFVGFCLAGAAIFVIPAGASIQAATDLLSLKQDWKRLDLPNSTAAEFIFSDTGELTVRADNSVAFLYRAVTNEPVDTDRVLKWRWRLDRGFPSTNLSAKGKDDRALAVHLWFADERESSVFGPLGWLYGYPTSVTPSLMSWEAITRRAACLPIHTMTTGSSLPCRGARC